MVWIAIPESINHQKTDFNDILKIKGADAIVNTINQAIPYKNSVAKPDKWIDVFGDIKESQEKINFDPSTKYMPEIYKSRESSSSSKSRHIV